MLTWLKRLRAALGRAPSAADAARRERWRADVSGDLSPLRRVSNRLANRTIRYVLAAKGSRVLLELAASDVAGRTLGLKWLQGTHTLRLEERRRAPLESFEAADPAMMVRLARVYEAASRQADHTTHLAWLPGTPAWLEPFVWEATDAHPHVVGARPTSQPLPADLVEAMLVNDDRPPDLLARAVLLADPKDWHQRTMADTLAATAGCGTYLSRHSHVIAEALVQRDAHRRVYVLETLARLGTPVAAHAAVLVGLATQPASAVRQASEVLLQTIPNEAMPLLERLALEGSPTQQVDAVGLLRRVLGETAGPTLRRLKAISSPRLQDAITEVLRQPASQRRQVRSRRRRGSSGRGTA